MEMKRKFLRSAFTAVCSLFLLNSCGEAAESTNESVESDSSEIGFETTEIPFDSTEFIDTSEPILHDYSGQYTYSTFQNEDGTWGYEILDDSSTFIRQPNIPAVPGRKGFSTEDKAETTASFVIYKLDQGFFPPSLTKNELDSLEVLD